MIYFLRRKDGVIKIGFTDMLGERLTHLRVKYPSIELLGRMEGDRQTEYGLHRRFEEYLIEGREWFTDCPSIQEYIAANTVSGIPEDHKPQRLLVDSRTMRAIRLLAADYGIRSGVRLNDNETVFRFIEECCPEIAQRAKRPD